MTLHRRCSSDLHQCIRSLVHWGIDCSPAPGPDCSVPCGWRDSWGCRLPLSYPCSCCTVSCRQTLSAHDNLFLRLSTGYPESLEHRPGHVCLCRSGHSSTAHLAGPPPLPPLPPPTLRRRSRPYHDPGARLSALSLLSDLLLWSRTRLHPTYSRRPEPDQPELTGGHQLHRLLALVVRGTLRVLAAQESSAQA